MVGDGHSRTEGSLEICEYCGRENPSDTAAINGKDTEVPISRPILRDTAARNRAGRAGKDGLLVGHSGSFLCCAAPPDQTPVTSHASNQNNHSDAQGIIVSAIELADRQSSSHGS